MWPLAEQKRIYDDSRDSTHHGDCRYDDKEPLHEPVPTPQLPGSTPKVELGSHSHKWDPSACISFQYSVLIIADSQTILNR